MENQDKIQDVLNSFEKTPSRDIPPVLDEYLRTVAKTGKTVFPWQQLKLLFVQKLEQVMEQFNKDDPCDRQAPFPNVDNTKYIEMRERIIDALQKFNGAPFTVQRICELVTQPKKHYTQCDKFLRGIEKNVMVVSTVDPNGRKIVSESSHPMVNGLDMNGVNQQRSDFNDFTDGQPFGPGPLVDWSGGQVATVWPEPINNDNKNNSNAERDIGSTVDRVNSLKSDEKLEDSIDSTLPKAAPEAATDNSEDELVVKDCVVKDIAPSPALLKTSSNEPENKTEKTENVEHQAISNSENSENSKQTSELSLDSISSGDSDSQSKMSSDEKSSGDSDSQSKTSSEEKCTEVSVSAEKHAMDTDDGATDEPPEKKLKVDCSDESRESPDKVKEPVTEGPASDESRVQDSTIDSSQGQKTTTCEQTETKGTDKDTKVEETNQEAEKESEKASTESVQPQIENSSVSDDNQTKVTSEDSATEQAKLENSVQTTTTEKPESTEHSSEETKSDNSESANSREETKNNSAEPETQNTDGGEEQKGDNSETEMMDTESAAENKDTEAGKPTETSDEGEPMEQE